MRIREVSTPVIYKESADFRFFLKWFENCIERIRYDTENIEDLYDPVRCPSELLWMLADTMGFKYDDRLPAAFNRLVLVYFMSMIRNKGSKDGVTLAAETNLAQFNILNYGKEKDILYNRLEDTSIPVNSVYVTPHTAQGYIDVVYFSDKLPIDACIEYVRPLGMYIGRSAGVRYDARTKISIDARLTNTNNVGMSIGPTHVGHYSREDYARMQKIREDEVDSEVKADPRLDFTGYDPSSGLSKREWYQQNRDLQELEHERQPVYYRNSDYEEEPTPNKSSDEINPGYRALYSLQLCNNEHIVQSLIEPKKDDDGNEIYNSGHVRPNIFGLGYQPQDVSVVFPDNYKLHDIAAEDNPDIWNLRYDKQIERDASSDVYTTEENRDIDIVNPRPAVNPVMHSIGDAMSMNKMNTQYVIQDDDDVLRIHKIVPDGEVSDVVNDPDDVESDYKLKE